MLRNDAGPAFGVRSYPGDEADWVVIRSELATLPFLSPCRVVVVEQADAFVTAFRPQLENYLGHAAAGVLILDVKTWASTTRLARLVPDEATIACKALRGQQVPGWCVQRAAAVYQKKLPHAAAQLLVELAGSALGALDQELAKLASDLGDASTISCEDA